MHAEQASHVNYDLPITDINEFPELQTALYAPAPQENVFATNVDSPAIAEALPAQETPDEKRSAFEAVRDLYYWAGAKYSVMTTTGEPSRSPVLVNMNALKRRQMVERGIGILACAKLGLDIYKGAKGFSSTFQNDFLHDLVPVDLPEKPEHGRSRFDVDAVVDNTLEYSHQGLEGATNALLNRPAGRRRSAKPKPQKAPQASEAAQ